MSRPDPATGEQVPSGGEENPIDDIDESEDNDNGPEENPIENMEEDSNEDGDRLARVAWLRAVQRIMSIGFSGPLHFPHQPHPGVSQQQPGLDVFPHLPVPGVSQAGIDRLPSYQYTAEEAARNEQAFMCSICLGAVEPGQKVRVLTCEHKFHAPCVDQWLLGNRTCPICRSVVQG